MKTFIEKVSTAKLPENDKGQLKQNVRNELRAELIDTLVGVFSAYGITALRVDDGVGIELPNTELGYIPIVIGATIKDLAFDVQDESEHYANKLAEKALAEKAKAEAKAKAIAEKEALKAFKSNKKKA